MTPLVSVCLPTYYGADVLDTTLRSVLSQTWTDFEVVIADDASRDGSLEIARRFAAEDTRIRVLAGEHNLGAVANWNRAVAAARGRYVKVMGQDDVLHATCLEQQVRVLQQDPDVGMVVAGREVIDGTGRRLLRGRRPLYGHEGVVTFDQALARIVRSGSNPLGEPVTFLLRRSVMEAVGPFRADLPYVVDLDYWCRALQVAPLHCLPATLCAFRVSLASWSVSLSTRQARQACQLFRELRAAHPRLVRRADLSQGCVRAVLVAAARRSLYATMRHRSSHR